MPPMSTYCTPCCSRAARIASGSNGMDGSGTDRALFGLACPCKLEGRAKGDDMAVLLRLGRGLGDPHQVGKRCDQRTKVRRDLERRRIAAQVVPAERSSGALGDRELGTEVWQVPG